jgi:hypothetical protein
MDTDQIGETLRTAHSLADLQHPVNRERPGNMADNAGGNIAGNADQFRAAGGGISPQDLAVFKEKFPSLMEFSDDFLRSRTMDELLRLESTSLRIKDAERSRETEEKLAGNKSKMETKFFGVQAGRDNRWSELHAARYLPGAAATGKRQYERAREVWGLASPPAIGCYDLNCVGMGGFVQNKGWLELGTYGSNKLKIELFNINNAASSSTVKKSEDNTEMKDISEFELALRTLRTAAHFSCNWNYSFVALENFFHQKKFFKEELKDDANPARTLCQFTNFIIGENANHWRDGTGFLSTGELQAYWCSFIGARPQSSAASSSSSQPKQQMNNQKQRDTKRKYPFVPICSKYNVGNCQKAAGTCYNFRGVQMKHVCNWRDPAVPNSQPCGQNHMRQGTHP